MFTLVRHYAAASNNVEKVRQESAKEQARRSVHAYYEIRHGDRLTTVSVVDDRPSVGQALLRLARGEISPTPAPVPRPGQDGDYVFLRFGRR